MNGKTNAKNGAGSIRSGCAVLEVRAPTGSQITAVRSDGLTKKQNKGYIDFSDSDFCFYYIIIQEFELSNLEWIVTATCGEKTESTTVLIMTNKEYEVTLGYRLYLYNAGDQCTDVTNGWGNAYQEGVTPTRTYNTENIYMRGAGSSTAGANGSIVTNQMIDISNYNTLAIVLTQASIPSGTAARFGLTSNRTSSFSNYAVSARGYGAGTITLDISSITGSFYVGFGGAGGNNLTWSFTLTQVYLE